MIPDLSNIITEYLNRIKSEKFEMQTFQYSGYTYYVTKNEIGAWLAYIDITNYPEIQSSDIDDYINLPFHCGCTFAQWTSGTQSLPLEKISFLIGCDWCHNTNFYKNSARNFLGIEDATIEEVKANMIEVIESLTTFRLKKIIEEGA